MCSGLHLDTEVMEGAEDEEERKKEEKKGE
jgi:hypothetical protein